MIKAENPDSFLFSQHAHKFLHAFNISIHLCRGVSVHLRYWVRYSVLWYLPHLFSILPGDRFLKGALALVFFAVI